MCNELKFYVGTIFHTNFSVKSGVNLLAIVCVCVDVCNVCIIMRKRERKTEQNESYHLFAQF